MCPDISRFEKLIKRVQYKITRGLATTTQEEYGSTCMQFFLFWGQISSASASVPIMDMVAVVLLKSEKKFEGFLKLRATHTRARLTYTHFHTNNPACLHNIFFAPNTNLPVSLSLSCRPISSSYKVRTTNTTELDCCNLGKVSFKSQR